MPNLVSSENHHSLITYHMLPVDKYIYTYICTYIVAVRVDDSRPGSLYVVVVIRKKTTKLLRRTTKHLTKMIKIGGTANSK